MTKAKALADFKENILPEIKKLERCGVDSPMRSQEWNNYVDNLCENKQITSKQRDTWTNPF